MMAFKMEFLGISSVLPRSTICSGGHDVGHVMQWRRLCVKGAGADCLNQFSALSLSPHLTLLLTDITRKARTVDRVAAGARLK